jgi:hypothetical protein
MGLWSVSMLVATGLLRVLRLSPSTMVALAQGLAVQVDLLALVTPQLGCRPQGQVLDAILAPSFGGAFFISSN